MAEKSLQDAIAHDYDDCAKKFLCLLTKKSSLDWEEVTLLEHFSQPLDFASEKLFFSIAVQVRSNCIPLPFSESV